MLVPCCVFWAAHFPSLCFIHKIKETVSLIFAALDLSRTSEKGARQLLEALYSSREGSEGAILLPTPERAGPEAISVSLLHIPHPFLSSRLN